QNPFGLGEASPVLGRHVVLALPFGVGEQGDMLGFDKGLDGLNKGVTDGGEQGGGGVEVPAMVAEVADQAQFPLELGDVDVEVHTVDALDGQGNVVPQDVGDGLRYTHGGFWSQGAERPTDRYAVHKGSGSSAPLSFPRPEPSFTSANRDDFP